MRVEEGEDELLGGVGAKRDERHPVGFIQEAAPDYQDARKRPEGAGAEHECAEHPLVSLGVVTERYRRPPSRTIPSSVLGQAPLPPPVLQPKAPRTDSLLCKESYTLARCEVGAA